jgi:NDP-sugar pyrophosphorylase family protein
MNLVLTMAGKYTRFRNNGYIVPKYLLPWGNSTILSETLRELTKTGNFDGVFLIANSADGFFLNHVRKTLYSYSFDRSDVIVVDDTSGQSETAFLGVSRIQERQRLDGPVIFHNIDTLLYNRDMSDVKKLLSVNDGYIDTFTSNNHEYSYVIVKSGIVEMISEKILISNIATSGLYGFSSAKLFMEHYDANSAYISDVYRALITKKFRICIGKIHDENDTIVLGTPSDYEHRSKLLF